VKQYARCLPSASRAEQELYTSAWEALGKEISILFPRYTVTSLDPNIVLSPRDWRGQQVIIPLDAAIDLAEIATKLKTNNRS